MNDLPLALKHAKAKMNFDDTTIAFLSDNMEEIDSAVNAELARLKRWLQSSKK